MDLHLVWRNDGRIFLKPIPRILLDFEFWERYLPRSNTRACETSTKDCEKATRGVALGFLYSYVCLIASENDFWIANEQRLLPRKSGDATIKWEDWKQLVREFLEAYDPEKVHPRFLRAELRLSRLDLIHRLASGPRFEPYVREWNNYGSFFHDNVAWMTTAVVFIVVVLTAMSVGLATDRLKGNAAFQHACYGFTVFSILGLMCAFGLVVLMAIINLAWDLPLIYKKEATRKVGATDEEGNDKASTNK